MIIFSVLQSSVAEDVCCTLYRLFVHCIPHCDYNARYDHCGFMERLHCSRHCYIVKEADMLGVILGFPIDPGPVKQAAD